MSKCSNGATGFEAQIHIATLRGLYGDLRENLDDRDACGELWTQIETTHGQLGELFGGGAAGAADSSAA